MTKYNVIALCNAGQSSKRGDPNTTGEKGLGFKSIFRICDHVFVESGGFCFRLSRGGIETIIPKWMDVQSLPIACPLLDHTYIIIQLSSDGSILSGRQITQLYEHLFLIQPQILLFLRRLQSITIKRDGRTLKMVKSNNGMFQAILMEKSIDGSTDSKPFHYMVISFQSDTPIEAHLSS